MLPHVHANNPSPLSFIDDKQDFIVWVMQKGQDHISENFFLNLFQVFTIKQMICRLNNMSNIYQIVPLKHIEKGLIPGHFAG